MSERNKKEAKNSLQTPKPITKPLPRTTALAGQGISSEPKVNQALDAIFDDLADGRADYEKTRYMLSAIGKKLNMENMKIRAGMYRIDRKERTTQGFFLKA